MPYFLVGLGRDVMGTVESDGSSFDDVIRDAAGLFRASPFGIAYGTDENHHLIAYRAHNDPEDETVEKGAVVLRIIEPDRVPAPWQPGGAGGSFMAPGRKSPLRYQPLLAPERIPHAGMVQIGSRGGEYPRALANFVMFLTDSSWKNDVADSVTFAIGDKPYIMFVDHAAIWRRSDEGAGSRYAVYELMNEDGDVEGALDAKEIDYEADSLIETDDPNELVDVIATIAGEEADPSRIRARMLEFDAAPRRHAPPRQSDPWKIDMDEDPRLNPARVSSADDDLLDLEEAKAKFEEFHRKKPTKVFRDDRKQPIPTKVRELGDAMFVLYRSSKNDPDTGAPVKRPINYIHDHDAGVTLYTPASGATIPVPEWICKAPALVLLGECLGFGFRDGKGKEREAEAIKPLPELYATPCGRALLVIQDKQEVLAIAWGGALGVEARGIVG